MAAKIMTVSRLIHKLAQFDADLEVKLKLQVEEAIDDNDPDSETTVTQKLVDMSDPEVDEEDLVIVLTQQED